MYKQDWFKQLSEETRMPERERESGLHTGIELESIVYYKDETHYFVMSAKKQSLLNRGVLKQVTVVSTSWWGGGGIRDFVPPAEGVLPPPVLSV